MKLKSLINCKFSLRQIVMSTDYALKSRYRKSSRNKYPSISLKFKTFGYRDFRIVPYFTIFPIKNRIISCIYILNFGFVYQPIRGFINDLLIVYKIKLRLPKHFRKLGQIIFNIWNPDKWWFLKGFIKGGHFLVCRKCGTRP